jgi:hypothetical protein
MNQIRTFSIMLFIVIVSAGYAFANDLIIFPNKGQSNSQMEKDKYDCYIWAKQQSGFDPNAAPTAAAPPPPTTAPQSSAVKGAARGAVVGVAVGAIAGDAGKGAAIGATAGGLGGAMKKRDQAASQQQAQQSAADQQAQQYAAGLDKYNRAYSACLEGKGYTVK